MMEERNGLLDIILWEGKMMVVRWEKVTRSSRGRCDGDERDRKGYDEWSLTSLILSMAIQYSVHFSLGYLDNRSPDLTSAC